MGPPRAQALMSVQAVKGRGDRGRGCGAAGSFGSEVQDEIFLTKKVRANGSGGIPTAQEDWGRRNHQRLEGTWWFAGT